MKKGMPQTTSENELAQEDSGLDFKGPENTSFQNQ